MTRTLFSARDAADYLGISMELLHHLRCTGAIACACPRPALYDPDELDRFAEQQGWQRTYALRDQSVTVVYDDGDNYHARN